VLGIGAAWFEREHAGLGVPFPPLRERFERLEETLRIAKQMWSGEVAPFAGRHYRLAETLCVPQPLRRPHPPILIGGMGEQRTLRLVARHADACNLFTYMGAAEVGRKLDVLRRHCEAERRDFDEIERTTLGTVQLAPGKQTPADVIRELGALAKVGVQHAIVNLPNVHEIAPVERLAKQVLPEIAGL
jgi:alkanesulfonate monooxygenase